jgi:hypothetical protein
MEPSEDILHMAEAKIHIERLASNMRTADYNDIVSSINNYLKQFCEHTEIIEDCIDINEEQTQQIKYCNHCGMNM